MKPPASNADLRTSNGSAKHSSEGMEVVSIVLENFKQIV